MSEAPDPGPQQPRVLDFWRTGEVWFRDFFPANRPWADETLLEAVPESARGSYGVKVAEYATVGTERYAPGNYVMVGGREELRELLPQLGKIEGIVFPWYDRLVPPSLWLPHLGRIDLAAYRKGIGSAWVKAFLVTAGLVAVGFAFPPFLFLALLGATLYGLFPLVETSMAWMRRVDRLSVEELNERTVNDELFRRWMLARPTGTLKIAVGVLAVVFLGQMLVDAQGDPRAMPKSIEAAALLKSSVLEDGEWWRLITTGLMHGSILHILFNGMALFSLGRVVVALVSPALLSVVFLATVVTGSLASLYFGSAPASVGASGGILGCLGFLLVVTQKFRDQLPTYLRSSLVQSTIVVSIFGLLGAAFIDNAAHAGGFLGGLAIGAASYPWLRLAPGKALPFASAAGWGAIAVLLAGVGKVAWELWKTGTA